MSRLFCIVRAAFLDACQAVSPVYCRANGNQIFRDSTEFAQSSWHWRGTSFQSSEFGQTALRAEGFEFFNVVIAIFDHRLADA
jgi:hypothetical protein